MRSLWYILRHDGWLPPWLLRWLLHSDRGVTLMMAWGFGVVMHAFVRHPQMLRGSYFGLCTRLFDSEDHRHTLFGKPQYSQRTQPTQISPRRIATPRGEGAAAVQPPRLVLPKTKQTQHSDGRAPGLASVEESSGD